MTYGHTIVWLDHLHATVIDFSLDHSETVEIETHRPTRQIHRKSGVPGSGHAPEDVEFFTRLAAELAGHRQVLITGPGTAKKEFGRYLDQSRPEVARRVVGIETLDHPSHGELLAYGRRFFKRVDQLGIA